MAAPTKSQNASISSKRLGALRKSMGKDIEMGTLGIYVTIPIIDGPIVLLPVDLNGASSAASLAALGASEANTTSSDPSSTPRAWWKTNPEKTIAHGLEESILLLRDILQRDRYDGVFGFSQGAAMAALLATLLERPHSYPPFLVDGEAPHPPFKFCIACRIFGTSYSTPTLHVLGRNDVIIIKERSKGLLDLSQNKRLEEHDGGHFVPSKANWREFLRNYLTNPLGVIPSPEPRNIIQPTSAKL
ncbi:serine hydrolase FSH [Suillus variegatus]|nr:serine hydrolase FSH [Suillus variegatus]